MTIFFITFNLFELFLMSVNPTRLFSATKLVYELLRVKTDK